jgi:hypothetical protein
MTDNAYEGILCHREPVIRRPPPQRKVDRFPVLLVPKHRKTDVTCRGWRLRREIADKRAEVSGMEAESNVVLRSSEGHR